MISMIQKLAGFILGRCGHQREKESSVPEKRWHERELKKIIRYVASGYGLHVELSKDAIEGNLKIGDEIFPVYVSKIDLENISLDCSPVFKTSNREIGTEIKIVRKFVLTEK